MTVGSQRSEIQSPRLGCTAAEERTPWGCFNEDPNILYSMSHMSQQATLCIPRVSSFNSCPLTMPSTTFRLIFGTFSLLFFSLLVLLFFFLVVNSCCWATQKFRLLMSSPRCARLITWCATSPPEVWPVHRCNAASSKHASGSSTPSDHS